MTTFSLVPSLSLDNIFGSLADATRRDILKRVSKKSLSVGQIAEHYKLTFAAISKHLKVLEKAKLIVKTRRGKEQMVEIYPQTFSGTEDYLKNLKIIWEDRFDRLDELLKVEQTKKHEHSL